MSVSRENFGKTQDGTQIEAFTIDNGCIRIRVLNLGAVLVNLYVPDASGKSEDIVLGFDTAEQYLTNKDYFGATIGPSANRIGKASFRLNEREYTMPVNDNENNLHTDAALGLHKKIWKASPADNAVTFTVHVPDGECGLPGERDFSVTYSLTKENGVRISYHGESDRDTIMNLTNHSYFNLDGHTSESVADTVMELRCSYFTPTDNHSIPSGEIRSVEGTAFDFRNPKPIGRDIDAADQQLEWAHGYDHNYCIDGYKGDGTMAFAAAAFSPSSGRRMEVYTDLPGVQFYAGNSISEVTGKGGATYKPRHGFCLETQFYPNSINQDGFAKPVLKAGEKFESVTTYRFSVR